MSSIGMPSSWPDDLGVGRLVALALGLGAHRDDDLARQVDLDVRRLPHGGAPALADGADPLRRGDAADLDVAGEPDAEVLAPGPGLALGGGHLGVAGHRERLVEGRLVVAGVDVDLRAAARRPEARGVLVRERVRRDEVPAPDLRGSIPISPANRSIARSTTYVASGRPAPR